MLLTVRRDAAAARRFFGRAPVEQAAQPIATLLLDRVVHASHALDLLHELAHDNAGHDPAAFADVAHAITIMTRTHATLIGQADRLTNSDARGWSTG